MMGKRERGQTGEEEKKEEMNRNEGRKWEERKNGNKEGKEMEGQPGERRKGGSWVLDLSYLWCETGSPFSSPF